MPARHLIIRFYHVIVKIKNMKLGINERLTLLQILPQNGSLEEIVDSMEIVKKSRLTEEEKEKINYENNGNIITWDINKAFEVDVEFTPEEMKLLKTSVDNLSTQKKVTPNNLNLCLLIFLINYTYIIRFIFR